MRVGLEPALKPLKRLGRGLRAAGRVGVGQPVDQVLQRRYDAGSVQWLALEADDLAGAGADIGDLLPDGGQQQRAQPVKVGAIIGLAVKLFGRGIFVFAGKAGADDGARAGGGILGDAEIDDRGAVGLAVAQDDIVGRKVAMDDAQPVRGGQPSSTRCATIIRSRSPRRRSSITWFGDGPSIWSMTRRTWPVSDREHSE